LNIIAVVLCLLRAIVRSEKERRSGLTLEHVNVFNSKAG